MIQKKKTSREKNLQARAALGEGEGQGKKKRREGNKNGATGGAESNALEPKDVGEKKMGTGFRNGGVEGRKNEAIATCKPAGDEEQKYSGKVGPTKIEDQKKEHKKHRTKE